MHSTSAPLLDTGQRGDLPQSFNPVPRVNPSEVIAPEHVAQAAPQVTEADMVRFKNATKAALDEMPKVNIRLPKAGKDDPNFETVQINGWTIQIMRGVDVMVPQLVKDILVEAELI